MTLRFAGLLKPRTIAGQIVILVLVSVGLFYLALSATSALFGERPLRPDQNPFAVADRFAEFVRLLDHLPADARPAVVTALRTTYPALDLTLQPRLASPLADQALDPPPGTEKLFAQLRRVLGPDLIAFALAPTEAANSPAGRRLREVAVSLQDGAVITGLVLPIGRPPGAPSPAAIVAATLGFLALMLTVLLWWATRGLTAPLSRFAQAAAGFSLDRDAPPLAEKGSYEVRTAARAFNRMQARIRRMVEDRTRMLAAVGHDLRTPITRLRLRAEFIEDEAMRTQTLRDLDQMSAMIHAALSYLRDGQSAEARSLVDLASLLQTVCDAFADMGHDVAYEGPDHLLATLRSDEISRAVTNLVENAVKFGTRAVVRLRPASKEAVEIEVVDNGPGIPDGDKEAMLEPFARGDAARDLNSAGGFGLGLSIVRTIAEAHGGQLSLHDGQPSGLIARLHLPHAVPSDEKVGSGPIQVAA
jgi:signal transduction histidine kinase